MSESRRPMFVAITTPATAKPIHSAAKTAKIAWNAKPDARMGPRFAV